VGAAGSTGDAPSDEQLVRRCQGGDSSAFDALVERYQRRATSIAYRFVGNAHDAMEVCQEAFIRAYRNLATLEDAERFGAWFLRIVTNLSLNFRRSRAVRGPRISFEDCFVGEDQSADDVLADPRAVRAGPDAGIAERELAAQVQAALAELPEQQRTALVLFSMEQMPQKDVAQVMDCSVEAVKWHVFQARRKLKEKLAAWL
jgi:RNA polymerase sigma-70 factor (ECF subfamily)